MESAILSAFTVVLITQLFRQLLPNLFAFVWQVGLSGAVPCRYLEHVWFTDKDSLFYKKQGEIALTRYPILSQGNLRSMVLLFGLIFTVIFQLSTEDIKEGWQALETLAGAAIFIFVGISLFVGYAKGKFNPDVIIWGFFNFMSFIVAFDFVVKNIL